MVDCVKAQIQLVLGCVCETTNWTNVYDGLQVYNNPFAVVATRAFNPWELVLAPATQNVRTRSPEDKLPDKAIDLGPLVSSPVQHFHLMPQFAVNKADGQNFVSLFWCVPQVGECGEPNMSRVMATHSISVQLKASDTPENMEIKLPMLKNHRKIQIGDLLCQGDPKVKAARKAGSDPASPAAKRAR